MSKIGILVSKINTSTCKYTANTKARDIEGITDSRHIIALDSLSTPQGQQSSSVTPLRHVTQVYRQPRVLDLLLLQ